MADVLTYVLHKDGEFNKNSLGAVSESAARAAEIGGSCHAVVVGGDDLSNELCASLGSYGATKVYRAKGPEGLAQPVIDVMSKAIDEGGHGYAIFGGGKLGAERPILGDSKISVSHYKDFGIIIGRINAFEIKQDGAGPAEVVDLEVDYSPWSNRAKMVTRGEQRGADVDIEGADVLVA